MIEISSQTLSASMLVVPAAIDSRRVPALDQVGRNGVRYGLVAVIVWIGAMNFTAYEARGISGFVANSPIMGWVYGMLSERQFSTFLGVVELIVATLITIKPLSPHAAAVGAAAQAERTLR